jgi:hypothetical protein
MRYLIFRTIASLFIFLCFSSVSSAGPLEDQYKQREATANRYINWCEDFSRKADYFVCKYQKPTDHSHTFDRHLVIHNGQRLLLFHGNYPYYSRQSRGLAPNGKDDPHNFLPIDYVNGRVIASDYKNRPLVEFDPKTGRLFNGTDLLACKRQTSMRKEVKITVCEEGYKMENPTPPEQPPTGPKTFNGTFSPSLNGESGHTYQPTPFK